MTRKNLKIDPEVYSRLKEAKDEHETWNHFFNRIVDARAEADRE